MDSSEKSQWKIVWVVASVNVKTKLFTKTYIKNTKEDFMQDYGKGRRETKLSFEGNKVGEFLLKASQRQIWRVRSVELIRYQEWAIPAQLDSLLKLGSADQGQACGSEEPD